MGQCNSKFHVVEGGSEVKLHWLCALHLRSEISPYS